MQTSTNKITYLDGLRGLAALLVFFHHFCLVFFMAYFTWDIKNTHLNGWDVRYGKSAFSVFTNGNFCVCVFFVLSGFVLSRKYLGNHKISTLVSAAQRRFLRLYIPVAFTLILAYLLLKAHLYCNGPVSKIAHSEWWFGNMWVFDHQTKALWHSLFCNTMFGGDSTFDTSMWTMSIEIYYSFVVFAFLALTHGIRRRSVMLIVMLLFCYTTYNAYLGAFILGIGLNYIEAYKVNIKKNAGVVISALFLMAGLLLGSYPSGNAPKSTIFAGISGDFIDNFAGIWYHTIGAFFLVTAFLLSPRLQNFISTRFFRFLGYISFSLYLLHPLLLGSFSSYIFLLIYGRLAYGPSVIVVFLLTTMVCFLVSWLMTRYIDDNGIKLSKYLYARYIKKPDSAVM